MLRKISLIALLLSILLLGGCVENRYGAPADEAPSDETITDEEVTDETAEEAEDASDETDEEPLAEEGLPEEDDTEITTTEDVIDDEGKDIGDVTTEITDEGVTTTIKIDPFPKPEGVECTSFTDCDKNESGVQKACINEKCVAVECFWESDCTDSLCFDYKCQTPDDIYENFERCYLGSNPCKDIACENCTLGFKKCGMAGEGDLEVRFCSDCISDYDCNEGYACVEHACQASE